MVRHIIHLDIVYASQAIRSVFIETVGKEIGTFVFTALRSNSLPDQCIKATTSFSERYAVLYDVCLYSAGSADSQQKVRKLIDSLEVTQQHVVMLVEGRLEDFFKAVLGGLANKYLDAFLPGLQVTSLLSALH
jgi:hypothetical protein